MSATGKCCVTPDWLKKCANSGNNASQFNRRMDGDRMIVNQSVSPANIDRTAQFLRLSVLVRVRIYGLLGLFDRRG